MKKMKSSKKGVMGHASKPMKVKAFPKSENKKAKECKGYPKKAYDYKF